MSKLLRHILIFSVLCVSEAHAQLPAILSAQQFKKGVYKTYDEFIRNEPSITQNFQIVSQSRDRLIEKGEGEYKLVMLDSGYTRRDAKKLWGACDGESIYINEAMKPGLPFKLKKMHGLGRYCYYKGTNPDGAATAGAVGGALGYALAAAAEPGNIYYIININTGRIYPLDKLNLKTILQKDKSLLAEYENADKKGNQETMISYIKRYNETHLNEAFFDRILYSDLIIYRRGKKQIDQSLEVTIDDTLSLKMDPNTIYKFRTSGDTINFCANGKCAKLPVTLQRMNYISCEWKFDSTEPTIQKVDPKEGQFYANEVKALMDRKQRNKN